MDLLKLLLALALAYAAGTLMSKIKMPAILGWLIAGMILGPHAFSLIDEEIMSSGWFTTALHIMECAVGFMLGTELVVSKLKKSGKQIVIATLFQSLGTFLVVTLGFALIFAVMDMPIYLSAVFGGIALATAPAPALSIVNEFRTDGPVTQTLIPMAVLDDIVGIVVFFSVISAVMSQIGGEGIPAYTVIFVMIVVPIAVGAAAGAVSGPVLKKSRGDRTTFFQLCAVSVITAVLGFAAESLLPEGMSFNFMLAGISLSAVISNMVSQERVSQIIKVFSPVISFGLLMVILNLGAPLDYHLILGAGVFTAVYIVTRALGKYFGAYFGAKCTGLPDTVKKYLGFTLLPHSGVSLIFTGISASSIMAFDPGSAAVLQGTIAAAAVINEIIAVIIAKKAFEWSGEMGKLHR